jgi:hypothetical protein
VPLSAASATPIASPAALGTPIVNDYSQSVATTPVTEYGPAYAQAAATPAPAGTPVAIAPAPSPTPSATIGASPVAATPSSTPIVHNYSATEVPTPAVTYGPAYEGSGQ